MSWSKTMQTRGLKMWKKKDTTWKSDWSTSMSQKCAADSWTDEILRMCLKKLVDWMFSLVFSIYLVVTRMARGKLNTRKLMVTAMVRLMVNCVSAMVLIILVILKIGKITKARGIQ